MTHSPSSHEHDERQIFCSRLKKARTENQMKQDRVARVLNVPVSAISAMEHGHRRVEAQELFFMAQLYKRPMEWFFTRHPEMEAHWEKINAGNPLDDLLMSECLQLLDAVPEEKRRAALKGLKGFLQ